MKQGHLPPTALIIASSVEPSAFAFSASLQAFLKSKQLDALTPWIVQVTQAKARPKERERLLIELRRLASKETNPVTMIFTSPAAIELLTQDESDPVSLQILQTIKSLAGRMEMAGVGATTTARIHSQWHKLDKSDKSDRSDSSGITIHPPAAEEGLRPCLQMLGLQGALEHRSVLILGAANGISQRVTTEMLSSECFFAVYQNLAVADVAQKLRRCLTDHSKEAPSCACVCQSGAAVRAIVQSFINLDESNIAHSADGTKFILYPRGASANLALQQSRLPAALLSCEDIPGSERAQNDGNLPNT